VDEKRIKKRASDIVSFERLSTAAREAGLTDGYIGNFELWGDCRCLRLWAGTTMIWSCGATRFTRAEESLALRLVEAFKLGRGHERYCKFPMI